MGCLDDINRNDILNFLSYLSAKGVSKGRILKCGYALRPLAEMLEKPFRNADKDDIVNLVSTIETTEKYADRTKADFKKILKQFYKWLKGNDEEYPKEVKWIKTSNRVNFIHAKARRERKHEPLLLELNFDDEKIPLVLGV